LPPRLILITRFFQLLAEKKFSEADRLLKNVYSSFTSEWDKGYFEALQGMLLAAKSRDKHAFFNNMDLSNLEQIEEDMKAQLKLKVRDDRDRGFFRAWCDYLKLLPSVKALRREKLAQRTHHDSVEQGPKHYPQDEEGSYSSREELPATPYLSRIYV
jgi:hypothetical protein